LENDMESYFNDFIFTWLVMKALDVEAVQAFILVADLNSFTRAAEAMDSTQSAISLKIKRLEDGLGRRLIECCPEPGCRASVRDRLLCRRAPPVDRRHQPSHRWGGTGRAA
jgi:hypothetical protein